MSSILRAGNFWVKNTNPSHGRPAISAVAPISHTTPHKSLTMPKRKSPLTAVALGAALLTLSAGLPAVRAVIFSESFDAGQTPGSAQRTTTGTAAPGQALTDIFGSIASRTDADLFLITIINPTTFSATTVNPITNAQLDTQLFLFALDGRPIYTNDDTPNGTSLQSTLPAGNSLRPTTAGTYLLGISISGYDPANSNNQTLFAPVDENNASTDVRGPAAGLQPARLADFLGSGLAGVAAGQYDIQLTGAVTAVPEPSTWVLGVIGAAGLALVSSRRRRATV